jgi:8-oxo-dGTP pyrophosphatase MutT (NUDIX family)
MENFQNSLKFQLWKKELENRNIALNNIQELHSIRKPDGSILFTLLKIDAYTPKGEKLLPIVLLRGHFVSVVTVLINRENKEKNLLLVKQRRVANGDEFWEHPAGMCDSETDPKKVCIKEIEEETGIKVTENQIFPLAHQKMYYSSPGLLDEGAYYFYCELELSSTEIEELKERITGAKQESEFIQTQVCSLSEALNKFANAHSMLQIYLYLQEKGLLTFQNSL